VNKVLCETVRVKLEGHSLERIPLPKPTICQKREIEKNDDGFKNDLSMLGKCWKIFILDLQDPDQSKN